MLKLILFVPPSEAMPTEQLVVILVIFTVILFVFMGVGAYIYIRVLAAIVNKRRDTWESSAAALGLTVDRSQAAITKTMTGMRGARNVTVTHFGINTSRNSADSYAAVEVPVDATFDFSFKISRVEMFIQQVTNFFDSDDKTGHEPFDKAFDIRCSHLPSLLELLNIEVPGGESPTLLTDLMHAQKRFQRVIVTDRSVTLGARAELDDSATIGETIEKVIYLVERIEAAAGRRRQ